MNKFEFLKVYLSPFRFFLPKLYVGKTAVGTPYFFPRVWKRTPDKKARIAKPKKVGFDFVGLGWKTKWSDTDFRFEWSPIWSFVFFGYQIALIFAPKDRDNYWQLWLLYHLRTKGSTEERLKQARERQSGEITVYNSEGKSEYNAWDRVLKQKYLK